MTPKNKLSRKKGSHRLLTTWYYFSRILKSMKVNYILFSRSYVWQNCYCYKHSHGKSNTQNGTDFLSLDTTGSK